MRGRGTGGARGGIMAGPHLARDPGAAMGRLPGIPTTEPAFGLPAVWIPESGRAEAEALGWTVVDPESVVVTHLTETIRVHASELLTRQETRQLLDQLKEVNAAVVDQGVPDVLSVREIQRVVEAALARGGRPVMLCSARVRRHLRRLWEQRLPQLAVCSYNEIVPGVSVETVGVLDAATIAMRQGVPAVAMAG